MTPTAASPAGSRTDDSEFDSFLRGSLARLGFPSVTSWESSRHRRQSSFRLDAVRVDLGDGSRLELVRKSTSIVTVAAAHRAAKPMWRHHPTREAWCYEHLLGPLDAGTARCFGVDDTRRWLLLESVDGHPLAETADPSAWDGAVRWLAGFHGAAPTEGPSNPLRRLDADATERSWVGTLAACDWSRVGQLTSFRPAVERATAVLADDETVLVHGEWFPTNILIDPATDRVCPVDWELAALGPAATDLASFTAGWPPPRARAYVDAYLDAAGRDDRSDRARFHRSWAAARVVGALHQLGGSVRPPLERSHDWWSELVDSVAHLIEADR